MPPIQSTYTFGTRLSSPLPIVRSRLEEALKAEGFGILTEIDVQATLRAKLQVESAPYLIVGACNPQLAHRALQAEPAIGALLPCNIVLREDDGQTVIEAMDPRAAFGIVDNVVVGPVAAEARERLERVIAALEAWTPGHPPSGVPYRG